VTSPFLSSEEYDERAHALYNEGRYDEAIGVLKEGLTIYPTSVELHVGVGYAQLAREEYAWARRSFERALVLEPEHEDGLAGLGEVMLKFGDNAGATRCFRRILELEYNDDTDLMLQVGRALFREGSTRDNVDHFAFAKEFFETAIRQAPDSAEAHACLGYALHRVGDDDASLDALRAALRLDDEHAEARIYLANILYDRNDYDGALQQFERTAPEDHWDELGLWRVVELKRSLYGLAEDDADLKPWDDRLSELASGGDELDELLNEIDAASAGADSAPPAETARGQLELFGNLLTSFVEAKGVPPHEVEVSGNSFGGSWDDIVRRMRDTIGDPTNSVQEFMNGIATHGYRQTGLEIPTTDAEAFLRGSAQAGLLRILR
jgi:tetratricopeptide (TPR) repeat protein